MLKNKITTFTHFPQFATFTTGMAATATTSAVTATNPKPPPQKTTIPHLPNPQFPNLLKIKSLTATIAATAILTTTAAAATPLPSLASESSSPYTLYYGTAASAANYGGYGGNSDKKASAEYTYDVPQGWKERLVSKVEKGTNGTDSEFFNPKKKTEKEYLTFLSGFRTLAPKDAVLDNLALSDVDLQDLIAGAEKVTSEEKKDEENGQIYYEYEIDGVGKHSLIKVTCARNKLYAHFVNAPSVEWDRDQDTLRHLHDSFKTVG